MNKELAEAIGARVKYRREQLDLSQEELAKKAGYKNKSMILRIEHGSFVLSNDKIYILAKALEITPEFLLGWADEDYEGNRRSRLISRCDELEDFEKAMVRKIMNCDEDFNKLGGKG